MNRKRNWADGRAEKLTGKDFDAKAPFHDTVAEAGRRRRRTGGRQQRPRRLPWRWRWRGGSTTSGLRTRESIDGELPFPTRTSIDLLIDFSDVNPQEPFQRSVAKEEEEKDYFDFSTKKKK